MPWGDVSILRVHIYYQYRDCHDKDKMFSQPPNLYHGNPHTWKESLYWNSALVIWVWTSYQIRKIVCCTSARNAGNVFPCHWLQRKLLVSDPSMHHGTCFTHVPWCMLGSLTHGGRENIPGILSSCAKCNFYIFGKRPMKQLTYGVEVLYSLLCRPVVHTVTLRQQHELVELTEDGVPRLMDGEHNGTAVTGQSVEKIDW